jgi:prolyl 4-hydroxylase
MKKVDEIYWKLEEFDLPTLKPEDFNFSILSDAQRKCIQGIFQDFIDTCLFTRKYRLYREGDLFKGNTQFEKTSRRDEYLHAKKIGSSILIQESISGIITSFKAITPYGGMILKESQLQDSFSQFAKEEIYEDSLKHCYSVFRNHHLDLSELLAFKEIELFEIPAKCSILSPDVKIFHNLLSREECKLLIQLYKDSKIQPASILEGESGMLINHNAREAHLSMTVYDNPLMKPLVQKICRRIGIPIESLEYPQIVEYRIGGQYRPHFDAFHKHIANFEETMNSGGNRKTTVVLYLNEEFKGGETEFPKLGITIVPKTGDGLYFTNLDEKGEILHNSLHAGLPVLDGVKYIMPLWFRQRNYLTNAPL